METQNENALQRLRHLEDTSRYQRKAVQEEIISQAPIFTMPIKDLRVAENQAAHFEARVIPVGDSKLKVEWLRNGVPILACKLQSKSFIQDFIILDRCDHFVQIVIFDLIFLPTANRITTMHDFGYVALNMKYVTPEDAGTYICRAVNDLGEAVTSATMFVQCKSLLSCLNLF